MTKYIAFEGIDHSGKSTQISLLQEWLARRNYTSIVLFEPTHGQYGREIREYIVESIEIPVDRQVELFTKDRKEHVRKKIRPLLCFVQAHSSFLIIQDRCFLSAPAYQAVGKRSMISLLRAQQELAPTPDIIFVLDVPVKEALDRQLRSGATATLFEREEFLERTRKNYLFLAKECRQTVRIIDGCGTSERVNREITEILEKELS